MSDKVAAVSPLGGVSFDGLVAIEESGPVGMLNVRGDFASDSFRKAVSDLIGADFPEQRKASVNGDKAALWMSPDELLVLVAYEDALAAVETLRSALAGEHHMVENVSDARAMFALKGAHVREVLAKIAPVDMSPDALVPGDMRRTRLAQVAAGFWMVDQETVNVVCFRSVAEYMFELLSVSAASGSEVGYYSN